MNLPPGPRLPRAVQATLWTFDFPRFVARGHARYGPTFTLRIGGLPTAVVTTDRDAIKRLFTGDPARKRHGNDLLRPFFGEHSVLVLEPEPHLARRRLLLPPFHGERVRSYTTLIERLAERALGRWRVGEVVSVQPFAQDLTLDVILEAVLGLANPSTRDWLRGIFDAVTKPANNVGVYVPQLATRSRWNVLSKPLYRRRDAVAAMLREHIAATRADPGLAEREDVLAMLVQARDEDGRVLTDEELQDELVTLIVAGHETTATAIAWASELLVHTPAVLERAREGDEGYMEALVKEVLRLRPPVPIGGGRHSLDAFPIGPWTIGPEHTILVDAWSIQHDPELYPDPHAFRPERFLEDEAEPYTFLTFGGGAHRCLGAALAQLEIKVVVSAIISRFELEPVRGQLARIRRRGLTLAPAGGGRVRVVRERVGAGGRALTPA